MHNIQINNLVFLHNESMSHTIYYNINSMKNMDSQNAIHKFATIEIIWFAYDYMYILYEIM